MSYTSTSLSLVWSATAAATKFKVTWSPVGAGKGEERKGARTYSRHRPMPRPWEPFFQTSDLLPGVGKRSIEKHGPLPASVGDGSFPVCICALLFMKIIPKALKQQYSKEWLCSLEGMPPASLVSYRLLSIPFFYRKTGCQDSVPGQ